jgi:hypothetical protein
MMMRQPADGPLDCELVELHDSYVWHVNAAVSAGCDDVAVNVAREFIDVALQRLTGSHR